ncbi:hypothetical protein BDV35DRAFT_388780 [Aspergillus flavus]|uniref:Oxidase ustYa n=1 Tax=Aspergillus flavus TaxID=5059 RepID=A0A5N6H848_ASPFL|nr:hypothetical protein BDV35DRAFT_388780 [Aspergillus flavus]
MQSPRIYYPIILLVFLLCLGMLVSYLPTIERPICPQQTSEKYKSLSSETNRGIPRTFFPTEPALGQTLLDEAHLTTNGGFFMVRRGISDKPVGYGISMLHQAHCIDMLRAALLGGMHDHSLTFKRDGLRKVDSLDDEHLEHCLDYIAQGILCAADDTIEPRIIDWEKKVAVVNGMNVVHQCRNSAFVLETVERSNQNSVLVDRELRVGETLGSLLSG